MADQEEALGGEPTTDRPPRGRTPERVLAGFAALCLACLVWPGFPLAVRLFPARPFGLPFPLVWSVGWILLALVVLATYHFLSGGEERA